MSLSENLRQPLRIILALCAAASPGVATAQQIDPALAGPLITDPTWTRRPVLSIQGLRMPANVRTVSVDLECGVRASGDLRNCVILHESRPDAGLGEAALRASRRGRASPETVRRMEPDGRVAFRLSALLPGAEQ